MSKTSKTPIYQTVVMLGALLPSVVLAESAAAAPTAAPAAGATSAAAPMALAVGPRVSPRSLRFGREMFAANAQTSAVRNVRILNPYSGAPLSLASAPSLAGANPTDFAVAQNQCPVGPAQPLAPGKQCIVGITFTPTDLGKRSAELSLAFTGAPAPVTVKLVGTGVSPRVSIKPRALKFANTPVGQSSSSQSVTVSNTSPVAVKILGAGVTGPFVADSSACTTIAARATCTVGVVFRPEAAGRATGLLTVQDNARGGGYTVDLSGTASKAP